MLTENSPLGMLTMSTVEHVIINFYPVRVYENNDQANLAEIHDYVKMCKCQWKRESGRRIFVCNNSPWSDMLLSHGELQAVKRDIYELAGWKPDCIINIYDKRSSDRWRKIIELLGGTGEVTIINIDANEPNFDENLKNAVEQLLWQKK